MSDTEFVFLSFEGPDKYSRMGGLATRVTGLLSKLAQRGVRDTPLLRGRPALPGHEVQQDGRLHLHRWCQWISQHHLGGAYDG